MDKQDLIESFINSFNTAIELPEWSQISLIDKADNKGKSKIRFCDDYIGFFSGREFTKHNLTNEESSEVKRRITAFGKTERFRKNVLEYEAFEKRRKELGVSDKILDEMRLRLASLEYTNLKTNEKCIITNRGSRYVIAKRIVKLIDNGELDINNISFTYAAKWF